MSDHGPPGDVALLNDPFRLGWRYLREVGPDGQETTRKVPLTERDLLFPQEEDFVVQRDPHLRDTLYLREAFRTFLRHRPAVHVFADHRIDFNLRGVEPLGPDVALIDEVPDWDGTQGTLFLAERGRPLLVVEITSPDTRRNDLEVKRALYERAGVPVYVVVDRQAGDLGDQVALLVFRLDGQGYRLQPKDQRGRARLPQLTLSLGIEDGCVWVFDRDGVRLEEAPELHAQIEAAEQRLRELESQLEQEIDLRRHEAASRREAEAALQRTETDLRRTETDLRRTETDLARERLERQRLEERLRELEARLPPPAEPGG